MTLVQARGLVKKYRDLVAVDGIDLDIEEGECFGFLGPNGAGKTSTMRMIGGTSPPTAGQLLVGGRDVRAHPREVKALVGVVPQENNLDPDLTVLQNLLVYARYFNIPKDVALARAQQSLDLFQLAERRHSHTETLSSGMKRRLVIARGLINQPNILILDEPTAGLDPQARHLVWQKLRYLKGQGTTMILTTQYMEEAYQLCDHLAIMDRGKILAQGAPQEMISQYAGQEVLELQSHDRPSTVEWLQGQGFQVEEVEDTLYIFGWDGASLPRPPLPFERLVQRRATLEDVFLRLTGRGLRD